GVHVTIAVVALRMRGIVVQPSEGTLNVKQGDGAQPWVDEPFGGRDQHRIGAGAIANTDGAIGHRHSPVGSELLNFRFAIAHVRQWSGVLKSGSDGSCDAVRSGLQEREV